MSFNLTDDQPLFYYGIELDTISRVDRRTFAQKLAYHPEKAFSLYAMNNQAVLLGNDA